MALVMFFQPKLDWKVKPVALTTYLSKILVYLKLNPIRFIMVNQSLTISMYLTGFPILTTSMTIYKMKNFTFEKKPELIIAGVPSRKRMKLLNLNKKFIPCLVHIKEFLKKELNLRDMLDILI